MTKARDAMTKSPDYNINLYGECVYFSVSFYYLYNQLVEMKEADAAKNFQQFGRKRINSFHLRELAYGKFYIPSEQLQQLEIIGQGSYTNPFLLTYYYVVFPGEFGIVYKSRLGYRGRFSHTVAVKTMKGLLCNN